MVKGLVAYLSGGVIETARCLLDRITTAARSSLIKGNGFFVALVS